jgi:hypothetical protein
MRLPTVAAVIVCAVLFCGAVYADTVTVVDTLDYTDGQYYFVPPNVIIDHWPYYRGSWEDWGWSHDLTTVPANATGILSATVAISAWDVDFYDGEIDVVYANDVQIGTLSETWGRNWVTSTFTLPESILDDLWEDGEVSIYLDIDTKNGGSRVAIRESVLTITYNTGDPVPEPATVGLLGLGALLVLKRRRSLTR